jgi:hypothetical protein
MSGESSGNVKGKKRVGRRAKGVDLFHASDGEFEVRVVLVARWSRLQHLFQQQTIPRQSLRRLYIVTFASMD